MRYRLLRFLQGALLSLALAGGAAPPLPAEAYACDLPFAGIGTGDEDPEDVTSYATRKAAEDDIGKAEWRMNMGVKARVTQESPDLKELKALADAASKAYSDAVDAKVAEDKEGSWLIQRLKALRTQLKTLP